MDAIQGGGGGGPMGGGGPQGPGGDLSGMLSGLGSPPQSGPPAPADQGAGGEPAGDTKDVIKQMIDLAKGYMDVEDDDQEKAQMAAVLKTLQDFLAREQKEQDDAMGGKLSPRLMRKSYPGG